MHKIRNVKSVAPFPNYPCTNMAQHINKVIASRFLRSHFLNSTYFARKFADKPDKTAPSKLKEIVVKGSEETDRLRIRRARPADVPRVLKFVSAHAASIWPGVETNANTVAHVILSDYVARALAQGHSMLAEQLETRKGWSYIRGVAIAASTCPWDAGMLMKWSNCVACDKSKKLMQFTAHCLKTPELHDKHNVEKLMQVTLIVPQGHPKANEIATNLMKSTLQRGQEIGSPLMRFDVTNSATAKILEDMKLTKEWEMIFNNKDNDEVNTSTSERCNAQSAHFIAVYSIAPKLGNSGANPEKV